MSIKPSDCTSPWASVNRKESLPLTIQTDNKRDSAPLATCQDQFIKTFSHHKLCKLLYFQDKSPDAVPDCVLKGTPRFANVSHNCMCLDFEAVKQNDMVY